MCMKRQNISSHAIKNILESLVELKWRTVEGLAGGSHAGRSKNTPYAGSSREGTLLALVLIRKQIWPLRGCIWPPLSLRTLKGFIEKAVLPESVGRDLPNLRSSKQKRVRESAHCLRKRFGDPECFEGLFVYFRKQRGQTPVGVGGGRLRGVARTLSTMNRQFRNLAPGEEIILVP